MRSSDDIVDTLRSEPTFGIISPGVQTAETITHNKVTSYPDVDM